MIENHSHQVRVGGVSSLPLVTVCRGCCCGIPGTSLGVGHAERLDRLEDALDGVARVRVSDCLGHCERADVVVVAPTPLGRRLGGRPVWLGRVNGRHEATAIADWIRAGGPGIAPLPADIARHRFVDSSVR